jgi:CubicO group peptidase (beta-lactamase class C family)
MRFSSLIICMLTALTATACGGSDGGAGAGGADAGGGAAGNAGEAGQGGGAPLPPGCAELDFAEFDAAVSAFLTKNGLRGASSAVVQKDCGAVHTQGYGEFPADRVYLVGSSSKVVSSAVLLRLADRGMLDLDAPIGQYVAAWGNGGKPELEVAQMLSNSSGLVSLTDNPLYLPYLCQYRTSGSVSDCAHAIYAAKDADKRIPPDTEFHYGGAQWQLAGGIAEAVTGTSWADLVRDTYAACDVPSLGFTNQFSLNGPGGSFDYPPSFQGDPANLPSTDNPSIEGGLYINALDYGKLLLMHLRDGQCDGGRVLSQAATRRMREDRILIAYDGTTAGMTGRTTGATAFAGYGLGWWVDRDHGGVFADPGLYGAFPWLDLNRNYGAFIAIEGDSGQTGGALYAAVKPVLDAAFDAAFGIPSEH